MSVIPNITFKALSRPAYYIYNRLGLVGGVVLDYKTVSSSLTSPSAGVGSSFESTSNYSKNSLALGYQAALGIQFRLSQAIRGFAEVVGYNQSFKPQTLELTSKGTGIATTVTRTNYMDQGSLVAATNTKTGQQPSFTVAMNSVGIGVGLVFRF